MKSRTGQEWADLYIKEKAKNKKLRVKIEELKLDKIYLYSQLMDAQHELDRIRDSINDTERYYGRP